MIRQMLIILYTCLYSSPASPTRVVPGSVTENTLIAAALVS